MMATPATRELKITYGSFVVGPTSDYTICNQMTIENTYNTKTFTFDILVAGTASDADFEDKVTALEAAFRLPYQRLLIEQGLTTLYDYNPDSAAVTNPNSGFNAQSTIEKSGSDADTGRSRLYTASVVIQLPADLTGRNGRRDSNIQIQYTPSRRRNVTFSGTWTAVGSNDALAQYLAESATWFNSVLTSIGGTYEVVGEDLDYEEEDKVLQFSRIYEELIFNQADGTLDDPDIVQLLFNVTRSNTGPGDSITFGQTARLTRATVVFSCSIDNTRTTDLVAKWAALRSYLITQTLTLMQLAGGALIEQNVQYDFKENVISGDFTLAGASSSILEARVETTVEETTGLIHRQVWDGQPFSAHEFEGPATKIRTTVSNTRRLSSGARTTGASKGSLFAAQIQFPGRNKPQTRGGGFLSINNGLGSGNGASETSEDLRSLIGTIGQGGWRPINRAESSTPLRLGLDGYFLDVIERTEVLTERFIQRPQS